MANEKRTMLTCESACLKGRCPEDATDVKEIFEHISYILINFHYKIRENSVGGTKDSWIKLDSPGEEI